MKMIFEAKNICLNNKTDVVIIFLRKKLHICIDYLKYFQKSN